MASSFTSTVVKRMRLLVNTACFPLRYLLLQQTENGVRQMSIRSVVRRASLRSSLVTREPLYSQAGGVWVEMAFGGRVEGKIFVFTMSMTLSPISKNKPEWTKWLFTHRYGLVNPASKTRTEALYYLSKLLHSLVSSLSVFGQRQSYVPTIGRAVLGGKVKLALL